MTILRVDIGEWLRWARANIWEELLKSTPIRRIGTHDDFFDFSAGTR